jgi:hypothetical protein
MVVVNLLPGANLDMTSKTREQLKKTFSYGFNLLALLLMGYSCLRIGTAQLGIDYADYYAAGRMVLEGDLDRVYDHLAHHAVLERLFGEIPYLLAWIYPPTFLLPIVPLSLLPFQLSYPIWMVITFIPAALSVFYLADRNKFAPLCYLLFPGTFLNIRWGQNGFLTAALIGFGIYFVESSPLLAGLMFGLLTFKPQMALVPFAILLLTKKWKALGWSVFFAFALALLSAVVFGIETWVSFFVSSPGNAARLAESWINTNWGIPTLSTALRCLGLSGIALYCSLAVVAILSLYACVRVWRATRVFSLRAGAMVICLFLAFPYVSLYDFAIFGVPMTLLFFDWQAKREYAFHPALLCLLWLLPIVTLFIFIKTRVQLCPFVLMGYLAAILYRAEKQGKKERMQIVDLSVT